MDTAPPYCLRHGARRERCRDLNQWKEYRFDAGMRRTARRPVAAGRIEPVSARRFGTGCRSPASRYLAVVAGPLASGLAAGHAPGLRVPVHAAEATDATLYRDRCLFRRRSAVDWLGCGTRKAGLGAWVPYAIVFLWQFPHFMAIARMYRDDYDRADIWYCLAAT